MSSAKIFVCLVGVITPPKLPQALFPYPSNSLLVELYLIKPSVTVPGLSPDVPFGIFIALVEFTSTTYAYAVCQFRLVEEVLQHLACQTGCRSASLDDLLSAEVKLNGLGFFLSLFSSTSAASSFLVLSSFCLIRSVIPS